MSNLDTAKKIIKDYTIKQGICFGIFDIPNGIGDDMTVIHNEEDLTILVCYKWCYFEVFGLTDDEFEELKDFYKSLC